jgi:hypothetical protein
MSDIILTKRTDARLTDEKRSLLREFLFEMIDGQAEEDQKAWRRFWNGVLDLGSGEFFSIKTLLPRLLPSHKKQMKLEGEIFKQQQRLKNRDEFRLWLKVGSGWVTWASGPKGGVFPVPKSISFARCDEDEFLRYRDGVHAFLRTRHAQHYLWPSASPDVAEATMLAILAEFESQQ